MATDIRTYGDPNGARGWWTPGFSKREDLLNLQLNGGGRFGFLGLDHGAAIRPPISAKPDSTQHNVDGRV